MKKFQITFVALVISFTSICQINFDALLTKTSSKEEFLQADSAIRAGEFGEIHSLLIVQDGKLVFEEYYNQWDKDSLHQLQSATKSIVSTLLGCAIQRNYLTNLNQKIIDYYPSINEQDSIKSKICIEDLLTQRHGLKWQEFPWDSPDNRWRIIQENEGDWYAKILDAPGDTLPGTWFNYSNAAPILTTGIIQKASGMSIDSFANDYLFEPLGIVNYHYWMGNGGPQNNGLAMLYLTSRDMAKIGQLYLQNGVWNDQPILPKWFVGKATSPIVTNVEANGIYSSYDYGYFWWSNPVHREKGRITDIYLARGMGGQNIIVDPAQKMIVVITAWNASRPNKPQEIFDRYIYKQP